MNMKSDFGCVLRLRQRTRPRLDPQSVRPGPGLDLNFADLLFPGSDAMRHQPCERNDAIRLVVKAHFEETKVSGRCDTLQSTNQCHERCNHEQDQVEPLSHYMILVIIIKGLNLIFTWHRWLRHWLDQELHVERDDASDLAQRDGSQPPRLLPVFAGETATEPYYQKRVIHELI